MKQTAQSKSEQQRRSAAITHVPVADGQSTFIDNRASAIAQGKISDMIARSPRSAAQRKQVQVIEGDTAQRKAADEEELEKAGTAQLAVKPEEEYPLQGKFGSVQKANSTGLPDNLKSGVESMSGLSMDDVKVHYNSSMPAQLHAHAYAQGTEIHLAPGQEQYLPHEAWHVVQQKQGRVRATTQAKGIDVNDDPGLELEATTMGERAMQFKATGTSPLLSTTFMPGRQPMQLARYIKSIQNPGDMDNEVLRLTHASPLDTDTFGGTDAASWNNRPIDLNRWLAGGAGNSTTHYNPGQNQYYSPVGYIVEVSQDRVLGNYAGDGSTSTLNSDSARYWQAVEAIRLALMGDVAVNAAINGNGYTADFAAPVTDKATAIVLTGRIEDFLANGAVGADVKVAAKDIIKAEARAALIAHYSNTGNYPLGPGGPGVLAGLEAHLQGLAPGAAYHNAAQGPHGRDNKYTESQVHAELAHVVGTFYATELGDYPPLINASWRMGAPAWLNDRRTAAEQFKQKFATAGNANVNVMTLTAGALTNAAASWGTRLTRGFLNWVVPAVGIAVVAYASLPYLQQLFNQYLAATQGNAE